MTLLRQLDDAFEAHIRLVAREVVTEALADAVVPGNVTVLGGGDSIQDAHDEGDRRLYVGGDYDKSVESGPIELDCTDEPVALVGQGHAQTHLPGVHVEGGGVASYGMSPTLRGFTVDSGDPGVQLVDTPYALVDDVVAMADGIGFHLANGEVGTFGTTFENCAAWNCGDHGFSFDRGSEPHAVRLDGCHAVLNEGHGFRLRGACVGVAGGSTQLNHRYGVEMRGTMQTTISGCYVEGNARREEFPVEMLARDVQGLSAENCYLHGINPRTVEHDYKRVQRALDVADSEVVRFRDNVCRRYGDVVVDADNVEHLGTWPDTHVLDECVLTAGAA